MPILNQSPTDDLNAGTAANAFEQRISQGTREHTGQEGQNANSPAKTFEGRITQETGTHCGGRAAGGRRPAPEV